MSGEYKDLARAAGQLRAAFDDAFAKDQLQNDQAHVDVLAIRVAEQGYALRLAEVLAIHEGRTIVPVPTPVPSLLGLVGLRGSVVPVFDLRSLLGHAAGPLQSWFVLVRATSPIGVAFDALDAHLRLPQSSLVGAGAPESAGRFTRGSVVTPNGPRPLIHLPSLALSIARSKPGASASEREEPR
ncbi:MAG TPA: chemotaxis protein CheW [Polyangiaceae bacterium]|nr:chemotaxis protein CheW [Polyangiaceae bacterium]